MTEATLDAGVQRRRARTPAPQVVQLPPPKRGLSVTALVAIASFAVATLAQLGGALMWASSTNMRLVTLERDTKDLPATMARIDERTRIMAGDITDMKGWVRHSSDRNLAVALGKPLPIN